MDVASFVGITFHAEPVAFWDVVQVDAVCMVWSIARVAEKELVLVVLGAADWTWPVDELFLFLLFDPGERVEVGNLFLVFDFVFRDRWP